MPNIRRAGGQPAEVDDAVGGLGYCGSDPRLDVVSPEYCSQARNEGSVDDSGGPFMTICC